MNIFTNVTFLATDINENTVLTQIGSFIKILQWIGIGCAVLAIVAALLLSLFASNQTKDTWFGRCKAALVAGVLIAFAPEIVKWILTLFGKGSLYKVPSQAIFSSVNSMMSQFTDQFTTIFNLIIK